MNTATKPKPRGITPAKPAAKRSGNAPRTIRLDDATNSRLAAVKRRSGFSPSALIRLGVRNLLDALDRGEPLPLPAPSTNPSNN